MLKAFRDNLKKLAWVLWLTIAVFVLLIFTDYGGQNANMPDSVVAKFGRHEISQNQFQQSYEALEEQYRQLYGEAWTDDLARQIGLPTQAIRRVVSQLLLLDEAERAGLTATPAEVRQAILDLPGLQNENGQFIGDEQYRQLLLTNRIDIGGFEQDMRDSVLVDKLYTVLDQTSWLSEKELEREARERTETATIRFLSVDGTTFADEVTLEPGEIETYFDANRETYRLGERRRAAYLSININTVRATIEIPEEDLRSYYDTHPDEFTREEQVRAQHILLFVTPDRTAEQARSELEAIKARIEAGEDFAALATELSEDEGSKAQGGDLGFFPRGRMTKAFEDAAFGGQAGELVGPIENPDLGLRPGFHLIKIIDRQEGGIQPFEEVQNRIRVRLLNEHSQTAAEDKASTIRDQIGDQTFANADELRAIAEQEGITLETLEPFELDDNIPGIGRGTEFANEVFALEPGQISDPIRIAAGYALVAPLESLESRLPELADVEPQVNTDALAEKRTRVAVEKLSSARSTIQAGSTTLEDVANDFGVELQESTPFTVRGSITGLGNQPAVAKAALALNRGDLSEAIELGNGQVVLFEVTERETWDPATAGDTMDNVRRQLREQRRNSVLNALVESRLADGEISFSRQFSETWLAPTTDS